MFSKKRVIGLASAGLFFAIVAITFFQRSQDVRAAFEKVPSAEANAQSQPEKMKEAYGRLPMSFEVNQGQADEAVKFISRGHGYQVFLTDAEAVLVLQNTECASCKDATPTPNSKLPAPNVLRFKLQNAQLTDEITGSGLLPGKSNYLIGNDSSRWRTNIPNYSRVEYKDVYPGVGMAFYGTQRALEYDFIVAPGMDPSDITVAVEGADKLELDANGDLILHVGNQRVYHRAPASYQTVGGKQRQISSRYVLKGGNNIGFEVPSYDKQQALVIDPVIDFSTFFGGIG